MTLLAAVRPHRYADSVRLMAVASALTQAPGVRRAALFMATPANLEMLRADGLLSDPPPVCGPDDLLIAVDGDAEATAQRAVELADALLAPPPPAAGEDAVLPHTLEAGAAQVGASLACISVPGEYAAVEAFAALRAGLHVFCFSDRVSLDDEIALKQEARARGLLMMGPDCGTAYLHGTGLGFHNAVRAGAIGLVAASGTGLQEAVCLLHRWGLGISHAIGTGGRDLLDGVGGVTTQQGIELLSRDPATHAIVLLAKAADALPMRTALEALAAQAKPAIACWRGSRIEGDGVLIQPTIRAAAAAAARAVGGAPPPPLTPSVPAAREGKIVGLFAGGSMLAEAKAVLNEAGVADRIGTFTDFGGEAFTRGRPHPMIDPRPRAAALRVTGEEAATAVLLFDIILGYGAHPDPAGAVVAALAGARRHGELLSIAALCGTEQDPQDYRNQRARLEDAGVMVFDSAAEAAGAAALAVRRVGATR